MLSVEAYINTQIPCVRAKCKLKMYFSGLCCSVGSKISLVCKGSHLHVVLDLSICSGVHEDPKGRTPIESGRQQELTTLLLLAQALPSKVQGLWPLVR